MRSALEGRWQGPRAASKGLPQARHPGSQLPSYQSHPPPVGIKRNVDNCNGPGKMTTERISNSCLKRWHLNHHTPLLTIRDREKKPVLSPKTGRLPRHGQSGEQVSTPKSKGLNGRFTGPYFFPWNIRQFICIHFSPLRPNFPPFPLICSSLFPISLI